MNPLQQLHPHGQSVWLDYIRRQLIASGELSRLIAEDGVRGMTSNPDIFRRAIGESDEYHEQISELIAANADIKTVDLYEALAVADIQASADALRTVYDASGGDDGYVSLEVSPHLADDASGSIDEARRLFATVDRPNVMIKVPGTTAGVEAIETLTADGININSTLLFSVEGYAAIAEAYIRGLQRVKKPHDIASVASFFVSRIDGVVDAALDDDGSEAALALKGRTAIANARVAYQRFQQIFSDDAFAELRQRGARPQRVLWASTSTKSPAYSDVLYVEELIGPDTVNTMPPATLEAFRDHGVVRGDTVCQGVEQARNDLAQLSSFGIDLDRMTDDLQIDGVRKFSDAFDALMKTLDVKRSALLAEQSA
ncbi:MAG: transaldolase [Planctomycetales bacterium]|nr:transaldolase [Planctomycetales bacterium]